MIKAPIKKKIYKWIRVATSHKIWSTLILLLLEAIWHHASHFGPQIECQRETIIMYVSLVYFLPFILMLFVAAWHVPKWKSCGWISSICAQYQSGNDQNFCLIASQMKIVGMMFAGICAQ